MKSMTCEMCGNNDLIKQDGYFICQYCGTKYTVEEAKKLMVEGTVKIDNSDFVEKYLQNARRAKQKEDWEEAEKYYNLVEQNDPSNIEAIFYSSYGKAKMSLIDDDIYKRQQAFKVLTNCVSILDDNYDVEKSESEKEVIESIAEDLSMMLVGDFIYTQWKNGYGMVTKTNKDETYSLFIILSITFCETINNIIAKDNQKYLHEVLIRHYGILTAVDYINTTAKKEYRDKILEHHEKIKEINPEYEIPNVPKIDPAATTANTDNGGCGTFIAVLAIAAFIAFIFFI